MGVIREVYLHGLRLYNAGDIDAYVRGFHPEAVLIRPDWSARGRSAIHELWSWELATFPDRGLSVDLLLERDDLVMTEWTWVGTHVGPGRVAATGAPLSATGHRVEIKGMEVTLIHDALIVEYRMYWDRVGVQEQLGLLTRPE